MCTTRAPHFTQRRRQVWHLNLFSSSLSSIMTEFYDQTVKFCSKLCKESSHRKQIDVKHIPNRVLIETTHKWETVSKNLKLEKKTWEKSKQQHHHHPHHLCHSRCCWCHIKAVGWSWDNHTSNNTQMHIYWYNNNSTNSTSPETLLLVRLKVDVRRFPTPTNVLPRKKKKKIDFWVSKRHHMCDVVSPSSG